MGIIVQVLTLVYLLFTTVSHAATKPRMIVVGGSFGSWKVPDSPNNNTLNHWAGNNRFKVGDFLVWKYDMKVDSVLQVTKEDYECCNTSNPLNKYGGGYTKVELDKSGPYFFISGASGNCDKGEKITLVVLSERKPDGGGGDCGDDYNNPIDSPPPAPTPTPAHSVAAGLKVGTGMVLTAVAIGLAMV
ncbi:unnamed protein product [Cochlearia groenlandica]